MNAPLGAKRCDCGVMFIPNSPTHTWCTEYCPSRRGPAPPPIEPRVCEHCGSAFTPTQRRPQRFCPGGECGKRFHSKRSRKNGSRVERGLGEPALRLNPASVCESTLIQLRTSRPDNYWRPKRRGDCAQMIRPCPYAGCRFSLISDVDPRNGTLTLNFPDRDLHEMKDTCALDAAERGGMSLADVAERLNVTRQRLRQIEVKALRKVLASNPDAFTAMHRALDERHETPDAFTDVQDTRRESMG